MQNKESNIAAAAAAKTLGNMSTPFAFVAVLPTPTESTIPHEYDVNSENGLTCRKTL
jgi:hypothetical protein